MDDTTKRGKGRGRGRGRGRGQRKQPAKVSREVVEPVTQEETPEVEVVHSKGKHKKVQEKENEIILQVSQTSNSLKLIKIKFKDNPKVAGGKWGAVLRALSAN